MKLYKYVDENIISILEKSRLKLTPLHELNDPFENFPPCNTNFTRRQIKQRFLRKEGLRRVWERQPGIAMRFSTFRNFFDHVTSAQGKHVVEELIKDTKNVRQNLDALMDEQRRSGYLFSLSEEPLDVLMWGHYSKSHFGAVLELECPGKPPAFERYLLHKVIYHQTRPSVNPILHSDELKRELERAIMTKSSHWSYEREWRTIYPENLLMHDGHYYLPLSPKSITGVILGYNMRAELKGEVREILREERYQHVVIKEVKLHDKEYKLVV